MLRKKRQHQILYPVEIYFKKVKYLGFQRERYLRELIVRKPEIQKMMDDFQVKRR
jgi:hypothetical protein